MGGAKLLILMIIRRRGVVEGRLAKEKMKKTIQKNREMKEKKVKN